MKTNGVFLLVALLALSGCVQQMEESVRKQLMDEALETRLDRYRQQKYRECRDDVMSTAIWAVDSAFRVDPILIELDTIGRPPDQQKPARPPIVKPDRDVKLEPIVKEKG